MRLCRYQAESKNLLFAGTPKAQCPCLPSRRARSSFRRSTCSNIAVITPASAETTAPRKRNNPVVFHSDPLPGRSGWVALAVPTIAHEMMENSSSVAARMYKFRDISVSMLAVMSYHLSEPKNRSTSAISFVI
jgi:hypothetical protein